MTTSRIRELAERHWNGEGDLVHAHHPVHAASSAGRPRRSPPACSR